MRQRRRCSSSTTAAGATPMLMAAEEPSAARSRTSKSKATLARDRASPSSSNVVVAAPHDAEKTLEEVKEEDAFELSIINTSPGYINLPLPTVPQPSRWVPFYTHGWSAELERQAAGCSENTPIHHGTRAIFSPAATTTAPCMQRTLISWQQMKRGSLLSGLVWMEHVAHINLGRQRDLPNGCRLHHPCISRLHARVVYITGKIMHDCFLRAFPNTSQTSSSTTTTTTAASRDESVCVVVDSEEDDEDGDAGDEVLLGAKRPHFVAPYYLLVNCSPTNNIFANRRAVLPHHSLHLCEGDLIAFLEDPLDAAGGCVDEQPWHAPMIQTLVPAHGRSSSATDGEEHLLLCSAEARSTTCVAELERLHQHDVWALPSDEELLRTRRPVALPVPLQRRLATTAAAELLRLSPPTTSVDVVDVDAEEHEDDAWKLSSVGRVVPCLRFFRVSSSSAPSRIILAVRGCVFGCSLSTRYSAATGERLPVLNSRKGCCTSDEEEMPYLFDVSGAVVAQDGSSHTYQLIKVEEDEVGCDGVCVGTTIDGGLEAEVHGSTLSPLAASLIFRQRATQHTTQSSRSTDAPSPQGWRGIKPPPSPFTTLLHALGSTTTSTPSSSSSSDDPIISATTTTKTRTSAATHPSLAQAWMAVPAALPVYRFSRRQRRARSPPTCVQPSPRQLFWSGREAHLQDGPHYSYFYNEEDVVDGKEMVETRRGDEHLSHGALHTSGGGVRHHPHTEEVAEFSEDAVWIDERAVERAKKRGVKRRRWA